MENPTLLHYNSHNSLEIAQRTYFVLIWWYMNIIAIFILQNKSCTCIKFPVFMYVCYDCESARRDIMNKTMELLLPLCVENIWNFTVELCEMMIRTTNNLCGQSDVTFLRRCL